MIEQDKMALSAFLRDLADKVEAGRLDIATFTMEPKLVNASAPDHSLAYLQPSTKRRIVIEARNLATLPLERTTDAIVKLQKEGFL